MDANQNYMSEISSNNYKKTQKNDVKSNFKKGGKRRTQRKKKLALKRRKIR